MKSPATPILLIAFVLYIIAKAILEITLFIYPYVQRLTIASYRVAKTLLQQAFVALASWGDQVRDYFYPINEENSLDVLLLMLLSDLGKAIAAFSRLGARICE